MIIIKNKSIVLENNQNKKQTSFEMLTSEIIDKLYSDNIDKNIKNPESLKEMFESYISSITNPKIKEITNKEIKNKLYEDSFSNAKNVVQSVTIKFIYFHVYYLSVIKSFDSLFNIINNSKNNDFHLVTDINQIDYNNIINELGYGSIIKKIYSKETDKSVVDMSNIPLKIINETIKSLNKKVKDISEIVKKVSEEITKEVNEEMLLTLKKNNLCEENIYNFLKKTTNSLLENIDVLMNKMSEYTSSLQKDSDLINSNNVANVFDFFEENKQNINNKILSKSDFDNLSFLKEKEFDKIKSQLDNSFTKIKNKFTSLSSDLENIIPVSFEDLLNQIKTKKDRDVN